MISFSGCLSSFRASKHAFLLAMLAATLSVVGQQSDPNRPHLSHQSQPMTQPIVAIEPHDEGVVTSSPGMDIGNG
ncbi:MAG TPA: hypothetical protein VHT24_08075, partial [Pseudacidobacterium sp.]|nr:hypothetical protein [Pseudacidobacterium sp.]